MYDVSLKLQVEIECPYGGDARIYEIKPGADEHLWACFCAFSNEFFRQMIRSLLQYTVVTEGIVEMPLRDVGRVNNQLQLMPSTHEAKRSRTNN